MDTSGLEGFDMKNILKSIYSFLESVGQANYAAHLARNGQWKKAQEIASR
jgi:hypothetical protein